MQLLFLICLSSATTFIHVPGIKFISNLELLSLIDLFVIFKRIYIRCYIFCKLMHQRENLRCSKPSVRWNESHFAFYKSSAVRAPHSLGGSDKKCHPARRSGVGQLIPLEITMASPIQHLNSNLMMGGAWWNYSPPYIDKESDMTNDQHFSFLWNWEHNKHKAVLPAEEFDSRHFKSWNSEQPAASHQH